MPDLSAFPITNRWPPQNADRIQLYSMTTPNGIKVSTMLEELGLPYDAHFVDFAAQDQMSPEFLSLNPNNKIPAILDPDGPGGKPLALFESGAILIYLAEKTGKLMSKDPAKRYQTIQWLMWQMGGLGPMFGQLGWLVKFAGKEIEDPRPRQRFLDEAERLLGVLDERLTGRDYVMDDYSIADIAIFPWLRTLRDMYDVGDQVDWDDLKNVPAYLDRCLARPASQKGITSPAKPA